MINRAFVSGLSGKVIYEENGQLYSWPVTGVPSPAREEELSEVITRGGYELVERNTVSELKNLLITNVRNENALFLFTSLLDITLDISTRVVVSEDCREAFCGLQLAQLRHETSVVHPDVRRGTQVSSGVDAAAGCLSCHI